MTREKAMKQWLAALVFCLMAVVDCAAASVHVRNFDALIEVEGNGDIIVKETLDVDIPEEGRFHGIFRDVPVVTRWRGQGRASMSILEVRLDGRSLPVNDVSREPGLVRVYQRDPNSFLSPGRHEFFLAYRMTGQTGLFEDNDELTWNVTGSGWEAPVDRAVCTVLCPAGAPFFGQKAWLGRAGSRSSPVTMSREMRDNRLVMRFETQRAVRPGEEFTVAAGWKKGFVVPDERALPFPGTLLFAALDVWIFLYFFIVWFLTGRDPKKGVVVPLFHPPLARGQAQTGDSSLLSPAAAAFLFHKTDVTPGCFGAAVISLTGRGCCRIEGNAREGFSLSRGSGTSPYAEENRILEQLQDRLPVDREHGRELSSMRRAMTEQLRRDYGKMWKGAGGGLFQGLFSSVWMFLGIVMTVLGLVVITGYLTGGVMPGNAVPSLVMLCFVLAFSRVLVRKAVVLFRSRKYGAFLFLLVFQTAALGFMLFFIASISGDAVELLLPTEIAAAVLALLIPYGFSFIMDAPTREARALLDEIEGLALYIRMAEGPALNALNPPERTLEHYRELLPYAVALDLEQAWGAHFSGVITASAASEAQALSPAFAGAFSSEADRSISSYEGSRGSSASSSSSFGDGGGGAGSGGGGGGGGGC